MLSLPENVLMTRDMAVKLCDFGLAREVAALRDPNQYTFVGPCARTPLHTHSALVREQTQC